MNLSPRNLGEDDLVESIAALLATHDLPPSSLVVELTETTVMASPGRAAEVMRRLRAIGVKISIDDFGTGHSSLAYLTTLPNDELKVDKSFIQAMSTDPNAETVVRAIVDLARSLQLDVVAEGVETNEDADVLREDRLRHRAGLPLQPTAPRRRVTEWLDERSSGSFPDGTGYRSRSWRAPARASPRGSGRTTTARWPGCRGRRGTSSGSR